MSVPVHQRGSHCVMEVVLAEEVDQAFCLLTQTSTALRYDKMDDRFKLGLKA